jgi:outer membrane protein assembly factor BamB
MKPRLLFAALLTLPLVAADWPQWRGPNRDGVSKETGLLKEWPKGGPKLLWTFKKAGAGYSCPAIVGDRLYTMGARDGDEYLICLDIKAPTEAKELWAVKIGPIFVENAYQTGDGPRATPTVDNGLVYGLSGDGNLVCVQADSGALKWRKSMLKDLDGQVNPIGGGIGSKEGEPLLGWGYSWSPLVDGDKLICTPGGPKGTVAALDKKTGEVLWRSKGLTEQCSYASPILAEVGGIRHYVIQTYVGPFGISADGAVLWSFKRPYRDVLIPTPLFHDNCVYVTNGHGGGSGCNLIRLTADGGKITAKQVYGNATMDDREGGVVLVDGRVFGHAHSIGWICQDFATGKLLWKERNELGPGSITAAGGRLYCFSEEYDIEKGTVVLIEASKDDWIEKGRFALPEETSLRNRPTHKNGRRWTPPVVANGKLFLRDQELIFCYAVK